MSETIQSTSLKEKLHAHPEASEAWRIRLHRAISWLNRAERESEDLDACFIFLWVAFNAAYAQVFGFEKTSRDELNAFLSTLVGLDVDQRLCDILFKDFSGPIRILIDNQFVFEPFWRALREHDSSDFWKKQFASSKKIATRAVVERDTATVLGIVFDRLYTLRNQLLHGGATWNSQVNRAQIKDGTRILLSLIPVMLDLILDHPECDLGEIVYPVVQ